jgi:hypothetical protein
MAVCPAFTLVDCQLTSPAKQPLGKWVPVLGRWQGLSGPLFAILRQFVQGILESPRSLASIETVQIWTPILNIHPSLLQIAIGRGLAHLGSKSGRRPTAQCRLLYITCLFSWLAAELWLVAEPKRTTEAQDIQKSLS